MNGHELEDIREIAERLETETCALQAISHLCSGCMEQGVLNIPDFAYLLNPIVERQQALVDLLHEYGFSKTASAEGLTATGLKSAKVSISGAGGSFVKRDDETLAAFFKRCRQGGDDD